EARKNEEKTLRLPVDQFATPVNARDVGALICAMIRDNKTGIYHLASDEYLSRVELAEKVLSYFPATPLRIEAVLTRDLGQAAPRPLRGGLKTAKIRSEYPGFTFSTVRDFLEEQNGF
ncbi:MAG: sugar nucleotide-binding protein, partial [Candidatus Marinimicrobia bacterium]|nr:sugar nucleotide-binding protein [Candidatus Neomarinimicrobiota bacterium]